MMRRFEDIGGAKGIWGNSLRVQEGSRSRFTEETYQASERREGRVPPAEKGGSPFPRLCAHKPERDVAGQCCNSSRSPYANTQPSTPPLEPVRTLTRSTLREPEGG